MDKEELKKIAEEKGITNPELFILFMVGRFPTEQHKSYVEEWADRFLSCNPVAYMDNKSKAVYKALF